MPARALRRLPGFRFEVQTPPLAEVLPRMDVACFVGFARFGPINKPVAVEDFAQFTDIFGGPFALAWDPVQLRWQYANLAPTVRAFFHNRGKRCWVIRVAGPSATSGLIPVPGLLSLDADGQLRQPTAEARSEGSWFRTLRLASSLLRRSVSLAGFDQSATALNLILASADSVQDGDLLSVTFERDGCGVMFAAVPSQNYVPIPKEKSKALWFRTKMPSNPGASSAKLFFPDVPEFAVLQISQDQSLFTVLLEGGLDSGITNGNMLRVRCGTEECWISVQNFRTLTGTGSPQRPILEVSGEGLWRIPQPPATLHPFFSPPGQPGPDVIVEKLTFEAWVKQDDKAAVRMTELGFVSKNPRFWGALPTDQELYPEIDGVDVAPDRTLYAGLWKDASGPRFPLSGPGADDSQIYFPAGMSFIPEQYIDALPSVLTLAEQDGLKTFDYRLFVDTRLEDVYLLDFISEADAIRYQSSRPGGLDPRKRDPRLLQKLHAALGIEEITLISVPDAVQRGWSPADTSPAPKTLPSDPLTRPEWWHFLACDPAATIPLATKPVWGNFLKCDLRMITPPVLEIEDPDAAGTFNLNLDAKGIYTLTADKNGDFTVKADWVTDATFVLEESVTANFSDAAVIATTTDPRMTIWGRSPGIYYYRAKAISGNTTSDWSDSVAIRVNAASQMQLDPLEAYDSRNLLEVQRALLRMCAARGDLFAVLSFPQHYRDQDAIAHIANLKLQGQSGSAATAEAHFPLIQFAEASVFSYAGAYHPWPIVQDPSSADAAQAIPPDGAACGILARRALVRGAWIAPANEIIRDTVALTPHLDRDSWQSIQDAQINLIRQDPRGFMCLSADTLATSDYVDLVPISVRRLLILLRRLALRDGANYVFEPNSAAFQRLVQRSFEAVLEYMFLRGAFAGNNASSAFQVVSLESVNTPQSMEQGRFIVELRVAPSIPMRFMTVRLLQNGDHALVVEEAQ